MLYIVASPIGNLGDITVRALEVLRNIDLVAAEDTRHSAILLSHYDIRKPLLSFHQHNEAGRTAELIEALAQGRSVALLTDAGMPGISDPGYRLISACRAQHQPFTILPGPSAVLTALVGSGLPLDSFYFGGFLPVKSGQRRRVLTDALERECTSVYFESPHRLLRSLEVLKELAPARATCVARELTKHFEEFNTAPAEMLFADYSGRAVRGEITLLIGPRGRREQVPNEPASE